MLCLEKPYGTICVSKSSKDNTYVLCPQVEARVGLVHQKDVAKRFFPSAAGHERAVDVMVRLESYRGTQAG